MNKKIIISLFLLVGLAGLVVFINFNDKSVEAAYLGSGLPTGSSNQTLRYNGDWEASSALLNDGTNITASGDITAKAFVYESDVNLKDNIATLENSLDKVISLEGVSFTWKDNGKTEIGLIAQDVEKVLPELVVTADDGLKAVKYGNIVALLIEAVKEQQVEINELRLELSNIK
jgi:hypothetical protein